MKAMDFFAYQDEARRNSARLVVLFVLAVAAIIGTICLATAAILAYGSEQEMWSGGRLFDPQLYLVVSLATLAVIVGGSLFKTASLGRGGRRVAEMLGGRELDPSTSDLAERRFLNVVEEMAIASGTPVPSIYILDDELAINAFAAGTTRDDAVVAVTRGCLDRLTRDELQGVVAHEFSHIFNGDMRLNLRLIGLVHGILVIGLIGYFVLRAGGGASRSRSSSEKGSGGGAIVLFGLALFAIGYIGVFFGKLIKSAVSRQREFLADAAAVQFTRNPGGIAGALRKIGAGGSKGSRLVHAKAEQASHLFFGNGVGGAFLRVMATHPPLVDRITRIDPSFDGTFPSLEALPKPAVADEPPSEKKAPPSPLPLPVPGLELPVVVAAAAGATADRPSIGTISPTQVTDAVGRPTAGGIDRAGRYLASIPAALDELLHDTGAARGVVLAMLLDPEPAVRERQIDSLDEELRAAVDAVAGLVDPTAAEARLPLVDLAMPALRRLSEEQYAVFRRTTETLVYADERVTLFEYALQRLLVRHLDPCFEQTRHPVKEHRKLTSLVPECSLLVGALARAGHRQEDQAIAAFAAARVELGEDFDQAILPSAAESRSIDRIDAALAQAAELRPLDKRKLLASCTTSVAFDGRVTVHEAELLRAVADALDCPLPPLL